MTNSPFLNVSLSFIFISRKIDSIFNFYEYFYTWKIIFLILKIKIVLYQADIGHIFTMFTCVTTLYFCLCMSILWNYIACLFGYSHTHWILKQELFLILFSFITDKLGLFHLTFHCGKIIFSPAINFHVFMGMSYDLLCRISTVLGICCFLVCDFQNVESCLVGE